MQKDKGNVVKANILINLQAKSTNSTLTHPRNSGVFG